MKTKHTICAWCYPTAKFAAQRDMRHVYSHGICRWHHTLLAAQLDKQDKTKDANAIHPH